MELVCDGYGNCWTQAEESKSFFDHLGGIFTNWWWILIVIFLLILTMRIVREKEALVIERLGKFNRVMHAGLRFKIPLIERVAATMNLQIVQIEDDIKVKTKDNVFVTLPVVIQYRVLPQMVREAYYELEEPEDVIASLIFNDIKSTAAEMELTEVFTSRDRLMSSAESVLNQRINSYGYEIVDVVINDPELSVELERSFNSVMAAQREQEAATAQAEALRIQAVGEATANAQGLKINAEAQVHYRNTLAEGNAAAVIKMTEGTSLTGSEVLRYFEVTDSNDAIRDAAGKGATIVVATPTSTDGLYATLHKSDAPS